MKYINWLKKIAKQHKINNCAMQINNYSNYQQNENKIAYEQLPPVSIQLPSTLFRKSENTANFSRLFSRQSSDLKMWQFHFNSLSTKLSAHSKRIPLNANKHSSVDVHSTSKQNDWIRDRKPLDDNNNRCNTYTTNRAFGFPDFCFDRMVRTRLSLKLCNNDNKIFAIDD